MSLLLNADFFVCYVFYVFRRFTVYTYYIACNSMCTINVNSKYLDVLVVSSAYRSLDLRSFKYNGGFKIGCFYSYSLKTGITKH